MNSLLMYYDDLACSIGTGAIIGLIFGLIINILLCHAAGRMAENKGYGYWGYWWLTFFLGIIGLIVAACLSDNKTGTTTRATTTTSTPKPHTSDASKIFNLSSDDNVWTCSKCKTTNPIVARFCSKCGASKNSGWHCDSCGSYNVDDSDFCGKCGAPKNGVERAVPVYEPSDQSDWVCVSCGRSNRHDQRFCGYCGRLKPRDKKYVIGNKFEKDE